MPLDLVTVPCLDDNYAFLAHDPISGETGLFDVPEAAPILKALDEREWALSRIFITHHHWDHVGGLKEMRAAFPSARVVGAKPDFDRLPPLDQMVEEGDEVKIGNDTGRVIDVSGHTQGHIAYFFEQARLAFTADSLMALGCGRVFEGTMPQMFESLEKLAALPPDTIICSGHEYTAANGRFAASVDPENSALAERIRDVDAKRINGTPTVPSILAEELATNPFLRSRDPGLQKSLDMVGADPVDVFSALRTRKDNF